MAKLLVQCGDKRPEELSPGKELYLDREWVTGGYTDASVSRRPSAALLFDRNGKWFVKNRSQHRDLALLTESGRQYSIGPALVFELVSPYCELEVGGPHRVGLTLFDEIPETGDVPTEEIPTELPPEIRREDELLALFSRDSRTWTITRLRFREFIPRAPRAGDRPRPLTAAEVVRCDPSVTEAQVNQAQRDIATIIGLDAAATGPWLVKRGILRQTHAIGLRHEECDHP